MYLCATLKANEIDCEIIDLAFYDKDIWKAVITLHDADIYGMTVYSASFNYCVEVSKIIKSVYPISKIVVGGPHPTFTALETISVPEIDFIVYGEGEGTFLELCKDINNTVLTGTVSKQILPNGQKMYRMNEFRGNIINIDAIPFPDRETVHISKYTRKVDGKLSAAFVTSRGCAYTCRFCCSKAFWGKIRFHSLDRVKAELSLLKKMGFEAVHCWDDTFTLNPDLDKILLHIKRLGLVFRCNGNLRTDTKETIQKLYDAGCREYGVGIESGDQKVLDIINKGTTVKRNKQVLQWCKEVGLPVKAYIMVGNPGETWDSIKKTVQFVKKTGPEFYTLSNFVPMPACEFYHNSEKYGIKLREIDWDEYYVIGGNNEGGFTHDTNEMTAEEIQEARKYILKHLPKQKGKLQDYYKEVKQ
jgi:anaerobic magnesium-protoporphyrin IX monomethyl ester cyclase